MDIFNIKKVEEDVEGESERIIHSKQHALKTSINEGAATSFASGIGATYITPFALALKATALQIGILNSFSGLIYPISQIFGSKFMAHHSRKKIVLKFVFLQALMWIPIMLTGLLFWKGIIQTSAVIILTVLYIIMAGLGGIAYPAWFSWIGDLIPERDRGAYLSARNRAGGIVELSAVLIGAILLDALKTKGIVLVGFAILFALASTFRMVSFIFFKKQYCPKFKMKKGSYFPFLGFVKRFDNYGKFSVYQLFFYLALMIASPFFAVYMLQELQFSYTTFTIVAVSSSVFYLMFTPLAGRFSDHYGNIKLFYIGNFLFVLSPVLWIFIKSPLYLVLIPQLIAGIANASLVISVTSFTYDSVNQQHRGICAAYTNLLIGIGVFVGSLLGGLLINRIQNINPFLFVFAVSAAGRFLVGVIFLPMLKEVKNRVKKLPPIHINLVHPFKTIHAEISWVKRVFK